MLPPETSACGLPPRPRPKVKKPLLYFETALLLYDCVMVLVCRRICFYSKCAISVESIDLDDVDYML